MVRLWPIAAGLVAAAMLFTVLPTATAGSNDRARSLPAADSPSGLPVPRFVALRKDEVRARFGPSFDYPVAYEFHQQGLPLKVIAEDRDNVWRRVEDRDGRRMWIHRSMLSSNDHAIVVADSTILRANPNENAKGRARLSDGVMTRIETCEEKWCRVRAADFRGWLPKAQLWGAPI
ncbi:MAG: SH3 domain-containing protein [Pseudomonadota bacterium]